MSLSKIYKYLNNKTEKPKKVITHATLKIEENEVYLYTDGTFCVINLYYKGSIAVGGNQDVNFRISYSRNKIRIINLFGKAHKEMLFSYSGNVDFIDCEIVGYNRKYTKPTINRNNKQMILNHQKTKLEDDSLILFPEYQETLITPFKAGYSKPKLSSDIIGSTGKFQKLTKLDENQISSAVRSYAETKISGQPKKTKISQAIKKQPHIKKLPKGGKY